MLLLHASCDYLQSKDAASRSSPCLPEQGRQPAIPYLALRNGVLHADRFHRVMDYLVENPLAMVRVTPVVINEPRVTASPIKANRTTFLVDVIS